MSLPIALILFRFLTAPVIFLSAYYLREDARTGILVLMYLGLLSDIFDGIIARKQNIATAKLRRLDSQTDMIFWLSIGFAAWFLHPETIRTHHFAVAAILGMELTVYVISFLRFGKETCTHAWLSKLWGLSLLVAFTFLIGFGYAGILFYTALVLGLISHIDRILITLILPKWTHDVPSAWHALKIRQGKTIKRHKLLN